MKVKYWHYIFIIVLTSLVYFNTFQSPFHFDDETALLANEGIKSWEMVKKNQFLSRYILYLSFYINYSIGGYDVIGYHILNLLLHIFVSIIIYLVIGITIQQEKSKEYVLSKNLPLLSALIFSIHPINTESVTYIISRSSILATFFYLLSLFLFIKGYIVSPGKNITTKRAIFYMVSVISFALALGTKEDTVTLPIIILLYLFYFSYGGKGVKDFIRQHGIYISIPIILLTAYLVYRFYIFGWATLTTIPRDVQEYITPWYYFLTELKVIVFYYIKLLLFPINLNVDPDIIMSTTLFKPAVIISLLSIFIFPYLSYRLYRSSKIISFSILWFLITLIPTSSIVPLLDFAAEHRIYLPMIGFSICFAYFIISSIRGDTIRNIIMVVVIFLFSMATIKRNIVWGDSVGLWKDAVKKSPYKARVYYNLGIEYAQDKQFEKALVEFKRSAKILPNHLLSHLMAGKMYKELGIYKNIIDEMGVVLSLKPEKVDDHVDAYLELSSAYIKLGNFVKAEESIKGGLKLNPKNVMLHNNMATVLAERGLFDEAVKELRTALSIKSDYLKAYYNMGILYEKMGLINEAIMELEKAISIEPNNPESHLHLGELYRRNGFSDKALYHLNMSIKYDSNKERGKNTEMLISQMKM